MSKTIIRRDGHADRMSATTTTTTTTNTTSTTSDASTNTETQQYVEDLMQRIRDNVVVSLQDEHDFYLQKLGELPRITSGISTDSPTLTTSTFVPNATTNSSSLSNSTIRPPSYKTAIKPALSHQATNTTIHQPYQHRDCRDNNNNNNNDRRISRNEHSHHHQNNTRYKQQLIQELASRQQRQEQQHQQSEVPRPPARTRRKAATLACTRNLVSRYNMSNAIVGRGALIVLEGLDRVGKSTLAKKLVEHLERIKRPASYCRFPDRTTTVGRLIDECLKSSSKRIDDHVMHLLFSANRWELAKCIRDTIDQGTTVVLDRYSYSGIAYSSAKKGLSLDWCRAMERGLPRPDLVIYLELPRDQQFKRQGFGEERFETQEMQDLVRVQYERVMDLSKETWLRISVENKSPDEVLGEVIMPVKRCLDTARSKELESLEFFESS